MAKSLKIDSGLWRRVEQYAIKAGYSSPEEFVGHLIERELSRLESAGTGEDVNKEVERRLRGLGYLE
jgi:hypothetical protein